MADHQSTPRPGERLNALRGCLRRLILAAGLSAMAAVPAGAQATTWAWGGAEREMITWPAAHKPGEIIVSFADRRLYLILASGRALSFPVAIPREGKGWSGATRVSMKRAGPVWTPTAEMRRDNPGLPAFVRGGDPGNPLGSHALYLGASEYRIHGTDAPWTIGQNLSRGCIRMHNKDARELFERVPVGTRVTVSWSSYHRG